MVGEKQKAFNSKIKKCMIKLRLILFTYVINTIIIVSCSENSAMGVFTETNIASKDSIKMTSVIESQIVSEYLTHSKLSATRFDKIIWSSNAEDLNGDGDIDRIEIYAKEVLLDNEYGRNKYLLNVCINDICFNKAVNHMGGLENIEIININKGDSLKELLISYYQDEEEDPSVNHLIYRFLTNGIITVSEFLSSDNGQINFIDDSSFTVDHGRFPYIKGTYELDSVYIKQIDLYVQPESQVDYSKLAACPFVYFVDSNNKIYKGEILRNLNKVYTEEWQKLDLRIDSKYYDKMKICIAEEKDEVSYINAVFLEINGMKHTPKLVTSETNKIVSDDENYIKLSQGEIIELEFDFEQEFVKSCVLYAKGYYIPN